MTCRIRRMGDYGISRPATRPWCLPRWWLSWFIRSQPS